MEKIVQQFLPGFPVIKLEQLSGGLIHQTIKVTVLMDGKPQFFVLQELNTVTFPTPLKVMKNLSLVQGFLEEEGYVLELPKALETLDATNLHIDEKGACWRMFPFVENAVSFEIPPTRQHLYEAGKAYGIFLTALSNFDPKQLEITIPDFHNLAQRYQSFLSILENAKAERKRRAEAEINNVIDFYKQYPIDFSNLPIRAVHNDSKLSNLLFNKLTQKCIAVIDLDTMMPGYVVTDFGDMVRGMCNTSTEDEVDLEKVTFDLEAYHLLEKGFTDATEEWLTIAEKESLFSGAIYIVLEQAIRFLSDYLDNDRYYQVKYEAHNYDRVRNQLKLLASMLSSI